VGQERELKGVFLGLQQHIDDKYLELLSFSCTLCPERRFGIQIVVFVFLCKIDETFSGAQKELP
jgi:hypothetical protein